MSLVTSSPTNQGRTTKPRPARQSIRFPAGANVVQAFGHDAAGGGRNINASHDLSKCTFKAGNKFGFIFTHKLVSPNPQNQSAVCSQSSRHKPVAGFVAGDFLPPKCSIAFWLRSMFWTTMPETTIHKNRELELGKNKVRLAENFLIPPPAGDFIPTK
jgi:hypothetical protein